MRLEIFKPIQATLYLVRTGTGEKGWQVRCEEGGATILPLSIMAGNRTLRNLSLSVRPLFVRSFVIPFATVAQ